MDAIASIFVNYHEERRELVEKTEAADLIEQNVAELMQLCYRGASAGELQFDFVLMLCRRLGVKDVFLFATEAGAPAWLTLGFEHVGSSASLIHLRFDLLFKRDRGALNIEGEAFDDDESSAVQERVAEYGEKQVVRLAKEAANAAAEAEAENDDEVPAAASTDVPEHDLLAAPSPPRASSAPAPAAPSPSALADASSSPPRAARRRRARPRAPRGRAAGAGAAPPRHRVKKRVVDDADADDEDEAWEPGRPSMMDLDDDEQEQAAKAKRKLKRRSRRTGPGPGRGGRAAPRPLPKIRVFPQLSEVQKARLRMKDQEHIRRARLHEAVTQEQERNAFLERIQAEEVRREQARIAAARPRTRRAVDGSDLGPSTRAIASFDAFEG
ncbi:hypothetical protein JL722_8888 [Aureococcus anophagefferens]|nr:hypothetical protein JL722_8888 [Aureococcus anophagefferens]